MIPQRNISLLSNRLVKPGGRRIREDVLERDYCLAWLLATIAESELRNVLAFKGGTALKRCYFSDYRFSEDLDFTLTEAIPLEDILRRLEQIYDATRESCGIVFAFEREDRREHANSYTFYLKYTGPLPAGNDVKVDVTIREHLVFPLEERRVLRGYEEFADLPDDARRVAAADMKIRMVVLRFLARADHVHRRAERRPHIVEVDPGCHHIDQHFVGANFGNVDFFDLERVLWFAKAVRTDQLSVHLLRDIAYRRHFTDFVDFPGSHSDRSAPVGRDRRRLSVCSYWNSESHAPKLGTCLLLI